MMGNTYWAVTSGFFGFIISLFATTLPLSYEARVWAVLIIFIVTTSFSYYELRERKQ